MAKLIGWDEVFTDRNLVNAEVKALTGKTIQELIAEKRKNPNAKVQLFVPTNEGHLPVKPFRKVF